MTGFTLSPLARKDLSDIWDYSVRRWGAERADHYVRQIIAVCTDLAEGRKKGKSAEAIRAGYVKCAAGSHVLFYRLGMQRQIEVMRILHQRMDIERHL